jgi:hypothetical protein
MFKIQLWSNIIMTSTKSVCVSPGDKEGDCRLSTSTNSNSVCNLFRSFISYFKSGQ